MAGSSRTFRGGVIVRLHVKRVVGTGLHARFAADAALAVEVDDAVGAAKQRDRRTNFDTRRIVAMIAAQHREMTPGVGIATLFNIFDPGAIHAERDVVFFLAGHRARMTADATVVVDDETVAHYIPF